MVEQSIIPLGAKCKLSGRYEVIATVPQDPLYHDDGQTNVVLDFVGVDLSCASDLFNQRQSPNLLHLQLRINEGEENTPSGKLLDELQKLQRLQRRSNRIYGDEVPIADLSGIPVREIGEIWSQGDFQTGQKYRSMIVVVERDKVE